MTYKVLSCTICNKFSAKQKKKFYAHLLKEHHLSPEAAYIDLVLLGNKFVCLCGCGEVPKWNNWNSGYSDYVRGHNARDFSPFSDPKITKKCVEKRKRSYKEGKYKIWNEGRTKETDNRVKECASKTSATLRDGYSSGKYKPWQTGLTKETDVRVSQMSRTIKDTFLSGERKNWTDGLTKETDSRILSISKKISQKYQERIAGKRLSPEVVQRRVREAGFELIEEDYKTRKLTKMTVKCKTCTQIQERTLYSITESLACFHCKPKESKSQLEIFNFVSFLNKNAILSDRTIIKPLELDIFVPDDDFAIEFNGLYWHSSKYLESDYHSRKTELCKAKNIKLLHIFEDEWRDKQEIVKSMIKYRMGKADRRIYARNCEIREVSTKDRQRFFSLTHLDGDTRSRIAFGLYFQEELVFCISLRKPVHKKWKDYIEIARMSSVLNTSIPGGLSKLLNRVIRYTEDSGHKGILSYADERHGTGSGYTTSGFKVDSRTSNRFWWTDNKQRFDRFKIRASQDLTEEENARLSGVRKIYGCANLVFVREI
jgi:hypothetical protein